MKKGQGRSVIAVVLTVVVVALAATVISALLFTQTSKAKGPIDRLISFGNSSVGDTKDCVENPGADGCDNVENPWNGGDPGDGKSSGDDLKITVSKSSLEAGALSSTKITLESGEGYVKSSTDDVVANPVGRVITEEGFIYYQPPEYVSEEKEVTITAKATLEEKSADSDGSDGGKTKQVSTEINVTVKPDQVRLSTVAGEWDGQGKFPNSLISEGKWGEEVEVVQGGEDVFYSSLRTCGQYKLSFSESVTGGEEDRLRVYWGGSRAELSTLDRTIDIPDSLQSSPDYNLDGASLSIVDRTDSGVNIVLTCPTSSYSSEKSFSAGSDWVVSCREREFSEGSGEDVNTEGSMDPGSYMECIKGITSHCEAQGLQGGSTGCGKAMGYVDSESGGSDGICQLFGYSTWRFGEGCVN